MRKNPVILLVEDDEFAAEFASMLLSDFYTLSHAPDGQTALDFFSKSPPDLVLLDISMPGMDGYEVCRQIRSKPEYSGIPVIFLSGKVGDEELRAGYAAGGDDFLVKPVRAEELLSKIQQVLTRQVERDHAKSGAPPEGIQAC